ncbi:MAG: ABC transporter ATP-binding protein [Lachnospiraceae bacterium]|nr:ABC transporter ATP-binding protein [Lachnospiraceae bacterium]
MSDLQKKILEIKGLDISFSSVTEKVHAIRGVDIILRKGETVVLVGESGSGKSVSMKAAMGILPNNAIINSGSIMYYDDDFGEEGVDLLKAKKSFMRRNICGKKIAMVFQDPMTSLNPTMTIGDQLSLAIKTHEKLSNKDVKMRAVELLAEVGITEPERRMKQYPHEFSGGMRQRIVIAIALSGNPEILICDEPTTALDVTIQERVLELIISLQRKRSISVIYITHDLGVVAKVGDYVNVMYAGKIIETGTVFDIFFDPRHPYTWGLLSAIPDPESADELYSIPGTPPNLAKEPEGDAFAPRNPYALEVDFKEAPPMFKISKTHYAATWLLDERAPKVERPKNLEKRIEKMKKENLEYARL